MPLFNPSKYPIRVIDIYIYIYILWEFLKLGDNDIPSDQPNLDHDLVLKPMVTLGFTISRHQHIKIAVEFLIDITIIIICQ